MDEYYAVYQSGAALLGVGRTSIEALREAIAPDPRVAGVPSTKGVL